MGKISERMVVFMKARAMDKLNTALKYVAGAVVIVEKLIGDSENSSADHASAWAQLAAAEANLMTAIMLLSREEKKDDQKPTGTSNH